MLKSFLIITIAGLAACADPSRPPVDDPPLVPGAPLPATSGTYGGRYRVPVDADLVAAADFAVPKVEWTVVGGAVTLHYDLPLGLVGGKLDVTFTGTLAPGVTIVSIAGDQGTGSCVATATTITCREEFDNLGALPISMGVVEETARLEFGGPVSQRADVAVVFGSDPIGIVEIDLTRPVIDDHGGDD